MCAIGRALMARPRLILLDEPSLGLAPQLVEEIFAIVARLNREAGVTFLLAEQNTNIALRYATYGYILENGRVVLDGAAETLRKNEDVKEFYLGLSAAGRKQLPGHQKLQAAETVALGGIERRGTSRGREPAEAAAPALVTQLNELLQRRLREAIGTDRFGGLGQLADWRGGWSTVSIVAHLSSGCTTSGPGWRGQNARWRWRSTASCRGMATWPGLQLCWHRRVPELHFDARCPTGVRGTPPHIDVIAAGPRASSAHACMSSTISGRATSVMSAGYRTLEVAEGMAAWAGLLSDGRGVPLRGRGRRSPSSRSALAASSPTGRCGCSICSWSPSGCRTALCRASRRARSGHRTYGRQFGRARRAKPS